ncbi:MAG TPA: DUF4870 domain-containing protein [Candidatus Norongarragalinales archaeon]|jgi:uncharacterized membrane protein|nr:DUF4870 domain-containing protein [Candidatus Norongarragalinales archaeon]
MAKKTQKLEDSKLWSALAYLIPILGGVLLYILKNKDSYARFHGVQSILFWIGYVVVGLVIRVINALGFFGFLNELLFVAAVIIALFLAWKAFNGERYHLSTIGGYAERYA